MLAYSGSYTGTSAALNVTSVPFQPDYVMTKISGGTADTWFITKDMPAGTSYPVRGDMSSQSNRITAILSNGFSLGSDAAVNQSGANYYYLALKAESTSDMVTLSYTGDNTDDKLVMSAFKPDWALAKSNNSIVGAQKFAGQSSALGNAGSNFASMHFQSGPDRADLMAFLAGGLYVSNGSSSGGNLVNQSGFAHYGVAIKAASNVIVGSYVGNGSSQTITLGTGFNPVFINLHAQTSQPPVMQYKDAQAGNTTNPFDGAGTTGKFSATTSSSFSVTADGSVNASGVTYWYMAIGEKTAGLPAEVTKLNAEAFDGGAFLTWIKSSSATGYKVSYGATNITLSDVGMYAVTGLTNGAPVTFTVKATNASGDSTGVTAGATPFLPSSGKTPTNWHSYGVMPSKTVSQLRTIHRAYYDNWSAFTLSSQGMASGVPAGAIRVAVPDQNIYPQPGGMVNGTVSEGVGYMLSQFAQFSNPQLPAGIYDPTAYAKFNCLWRYINYYKDANGLMNWNIGNEGTIYGTGSATDGDYDIADALVKMHRIHGSTGAFNYGSLATNYINAIGTYCFAPSTYPTYPNIALNGDMWGVDTDNYMSDYFRPGILREFYYHTGDTAWLARISANYVYALKYFYDNTTGGLVPDRQTRSNTAIAGWSPFKATYNSVRLGYGVSTDYLWNGGAVADSLGYNTLDRMATNMKTLYTNAAGLKSPDYNMDGTSTQAYTNGSALGLVTPAALMSTGNQTFATQLVDAISANTDQNNSYYNGGVALMGMSMASGLNQTYRTASAPANTTNFFTFF